MRKNIIISVIFIFLLTFLGCITSKKRLVLRDNKLVGTWKYEKIMPENISENTAKEEVGKILLDMNKNSSITFNQDKSYKIVFNGEQATGTWTLDGDGTILKMKEGNKDKHLTVSQFTEATITISAEAESGKVTLQLKKQ